MKAFRALVPAALLISAAIVFASVSGFSRPADASVPPSGPTRSGKVGGSPGFAPPEADEGPSAQASQSTFSGDCPVITASQTWFGPIRRLCINLNGTPSFSDVNGDGKTDFFKFNWGGAQVLPVPAGQECLAFLSEVWVEDGETVHRSTCVLERQKVADWVVANLGWNTAFLSSRYQNDWRDVDGDGDLDLLLSLTQTDDPFGSPAVHIWLENTGFEASQPLTGDLNSDGNVNSADLALLLGGWTGG